jgi:hypothetical protein
MWMGTHSMMNTMVRMQELNVDIVAIEIVL